MIKYINLVLKEIKNIIKREMSGKMHYSYFLLKPDGIRFLDDICRDIEQKYESVRYYAISDFEKVIKRLYHRHYEQKGDKFSKSFDSYLYGLRELFGNESVLILVQDSKKSYENLIQTVFDTKMEIRKKYTNNKVGLVTDYGDDRKYIRFLSQAGDETRPRIMDSLGSYRISDMNIIHCPDATKEATIDELKILIDEGIIDERNLITYDMIRKMKKYQTINFQRDMREEGYEGEIQPDISGWIKGNIKEDLHDEYR